MKVTEEMINTFKVVEVCDCHPEDEIGTRLQAVMDLPEMQALERFARAAAAHVTTDGTDEWNHMVEVWDSLPDSVVKNLLEPR